MKKICIQGIAFDEKSSYLRGAKLAPPLIREALHSGAINHFAENGTSVSTSNVEDRGDFDISDYFSIETITAKHIATGSKLLSLGGDHSITYPIIKALHAQYPKLDVLHFDAHPDLYHSYENDKYSHACPFARIMENGYAQRLVQIGIRASNPHQAAQAKKYKVELHPMQTLNPEWIPDFKNPLYVSFDMDCLDPAYAPGVSHYEAGGLTTRQAIHFIQKIRGHVVGADIVEYNPKRDLHNMTAFVAVKIMKELIAKMIES